MTAAEITKRLLETGVEDPDDPNVFVRHFKDQWERYGFEATTSSGGEEQWIWREGIFSVEVTHHKEPEGWRAMRGAANWEIYGFIDVGEKRQNAYARKQAVTEAKALQTAVRLKNEIMGSMAARLTKLGFTGWRNHWHRAPITVTLKPKYANIELRMDYVPNEKVADAVARLVKVSDKLLPQD